MNMAFKIMMFSIFFGIALGIVTLIPGVSLNNTNNTAYYGDFINNPTLNGTVNINQTYLNEHESNLTFNTSTPASNPGGFFNSVISIITLEWARNINDWSKKWIFGIVTYIFDPLFRSSLGGAAEYVFTAMKAVMTIMYFIFIFSLFTDKRLDT